MLIEKWMKREVHSIKPLDTIQHARDLMEQHRINQLPVVVNDQNPGFSHETTRGLAMSVPHPAAARALLSSH